MVILYNIMKTNESKLIKIYVYLFFFTFILNHFNFYLTRNSTFSLFTPTKLLYLVFISSSYLFFGLLFLFLQININVTYCLLCLHCIFSLSILYKFIGSFVEIQACLWLLMGILHLLFCIILHGSQVSYRSMHLITII